MIMPLVSNAAQMLGSIPNALGFGDADADGNSPWNNVDDCFASTFTVEVPFDGIAI